MQRSTVKKILSALLVAGLIAWGIYRAQSASSGPVLARGEHHQTGETSMSDSNTAARPTNRLIHEASPYLQQHAHNPVDWYPWGEEALERARREDKPIFLSIGYSSCHWCHVMEHESFNNADIAAVMNRHFINIKVDREQRPDIDSIYMDAVQMMTGSGGWPLSVFLTPDGRPFYGGTYFPPQDHYGRPGFKRLLLALSDAWQNRRSELLASATKMQELLGQQDPTAGAVSVDSLAATHAALTQSFDSRQGGFGGAPKFPQPSILLFILRAWNRNQDNETLTMVTRTLDAMAQGGIYDHLGGGFHRYATDDHWLVPHFEKMLYDQALIGRAYVAGYQVTGRDTYARIVRETFDYVLRDMTDASGGFYSAQDADSEGEEGIYYVWTPQQIQSLLGETDAQDFNKRYGVTSAGNFEHHTSILNLKRSWEEEFDTPVRRDRFEKSRQQLLAARTQRVPPLRDDKIITAWNGLMITALAQGGAALQEPRYVAAARRAADYVLEQLRPGGRLQRSALQGKVSGPGYLDDYAFFIEGLLALYEATFELRWLREAVQLADHMVDLFGDDNGGALYLVGRDAERLVVRDKPQYDGAVPSGNSVAAMVLLRLGRITTQLHFTERAETILNSAALRWQQAPVSQIALAAALDYHLAPGQEITLAGDVQQGGGQAMARWLQTMYLPNSVVIHRPAGETSAELLELAPYVANQGPVGDVATAYVCENYACKRPVNGVNDLSALLDLSPEGQPTAK
ncbi:thioredoxin domain-containing protein [Planctomycetota bacterium]